MRVFSDSRCLSHAVPPGYPERAERLEAVREALVTGPREIVEAGVHPRVEAAILGVHTERYYERFAAAVARGDGLFDSADNPISEATFVAATAAVEAGLHAADWVAGEPGRRAFAAVRPPGHHAERDRAMGFCFFDNVAVAAAYLIAHHGAASVAIVDFDVHHGNGTQRIFEERGDVFYLSLHQAPFYPGTGRAEEIGRGPGEGATLNLPLPAGTGDAGYAEAFRERVLPALRRWRPEVLLVSAGFDAWRADPLGGMRVTEEGFAAWGRWLGGIAEECCGGRVLSFLEGGYDLARLGDLAARYLAAQDEGTN